MGDRGAVHGLPAQRRARPGVQRVSVVGACETCESGVRYLFDWHCPACMARHYTLVLTEKERPARRAQLHARWSKERFEEFEQALRECGDGRGLDQAGEVLTGQAGSDAAGAAVGDSAGPGVRRPDAILDMD